MHFFDSTDYEAGASEQETSASRFIAIGVAKQA